MKMALSDNNWKLLCSITLMPMKRSRGFGKRCHSSVARTSAKMSLLHR